LRGVPPEIMRRALVIADEVRNVLEDEPQAAVMGALVLVCSETLMNLELTVDRQLAIDLFTKQVAEIAAEFSPKKL
jgi:hypothetical protein